MGWLDRTKLEGVSKQAALEWMRRLIELALGDPHRRARRDAGRQAGEGPRKEAR
jgi:hypothetical protein